MKFGFFNFNMAYSIRPDDLAVALEQRGYDSLWLGEHTHIPVDQSTPYIIDGDETPIPYAHIMDPFISLMAAASVTKNLKLATGICLLIQRDPIVTAKEVATLDVLSGGRVIFGIGGGWNVDEIENHGTPFKLRWKILRERVLAMKCLWTDEQAEFAGEFVNFGPLLSYPKPVQTPHPPVVLGTITKGGLQQVVDYCDGWCPLDAQIDDFPTMISELHRRCAVAGRDPASISIMIFAWGDPDEALLRSYYEMGVDTVILGAGRQDPDVKDAVLPFLDRYADLVTELA
jgi:probable F420-dependent oxidoreductase